MRSGSLALKTVVLAVILMAGIASCSVKSSVHDASVKVNAGINLSILPAVLANTKETVKTASNVVQKG